MFAALAASCALLQVQARDEAKDWRLLKTENFDLYYPSDALEPRAREFAGLFEDARERIRGTCGAALRRRVSVFLYASVHDLSKASFLGRLRAESPRAAVRGPLLREPRGTPCCRLARSRAFALAEPLQDRIFLHVQASDRWNAWFARHELVHQLQFQEIYPWRTPSYLLALKDPLVPQWFWEGFADYGAGIFDSAKDEWVRDLAEERLYTLKELFSADALDDHDFLAVYYQASLFFTFLDEEIGAGTATDVFRTYAKTFPLTMDRVLRSSTGRGRKELEAAFAGWLKRRYASDRSHPTQTRVTDSRSHYRRRTWGGRYSPDGRRLAWVSDDDTRADVYVDGIGLLGKRRGLDLDGVHSPPSWAPDGNRLVVAGFWRHRDFLLLVDADGGFDAIKLDFDEIHDPAWSPAGDAVAFAGLKDGASDLWLYRLDSGRVERLTEDAGGDAAPAWRPDGARLAYVHEREGRTELVVLDLTTKDRQVVGKTLSLIERPQWTLDGRSVVVAADVDGAYDAFAIEVASGKASRLTRFRGGVHFPQVSPDGRTLLFTYFWGRGTDLWTVPVEPQEEKRFGQEERGPWFESFRKPAPRGERAEKSRRWGLEWLMLPVTSASFVTPGLELQLGDLDGENVLTLQGMGVSKELWQASATLLNTRWPPNAGISAFGGAQGDLRVAGVEPFVSIPHVFSSFGWLARDTHEFDDAGADPHFFDSGPTASFLYSSLAGAQPRDPSWGLGLAASASVFRDGLGGDRDLNEYFAAFEWSTAISQDVLLWARGAYEKKVGGPLLEDEILGIEGAVRGGELLEGTDRGSFTLELRFPIARNLLWLPLEPIGLGEFLLIKDLRGFVFGEAGFAGLRARDALDDDFGAASAGVGVRIDFFWMAWPVANVRVPARLEIWAAIVGQDEEDARGEIGVGIRLGF